MNDNRPNDDQNIVIELVGQPPSKAPEMQVNLNGDDDSTHSHQIDSLNLLVSEINQVKGLLEQRMDGIDCHFQFFQDPNSYNAVYCRAIDYLTCGITYCLKHPRFRMFMLQCQLCCHQWMKLPYFSEQETTPREEDQEVITGEYQGLENMNKKNIIMQHKGVGNSKPQSGKGIRVKRQVFVRQITLFMKDFVYPHMSTVIFNLQFLSETLGSQVKFIRFFPAFFFFSLIVMVIPIIPYGIVFWMAFGAKERNYIYTLATFYSREVYRGPTLDITTMSKLITHLGFIGLTLTISFGFWGSVTYIERHRQQLVSSSDDSYFFDVLILSFLNLLIALILLFAGFLGALSGNHHLFISQRSFIKKEMDRCYIDPGLFYLEFITQSFGDPIISFVLSTHPNRHVNRKLKVMAKMEPINKHWTEMQELLECYLLTYHKECLTKNNFLKDMFLSEAHDWYTNNKVHGAKVQPAYNHNQTFIEFKQNFRKGDLQQHDLIAKYAKVYERHLVHQIMAHYDPDLRETLLELLEQDFVENRKERREVKIQIGAKKVIDVAPSRNSMNLGQDLLERLKWIRIKDFRKSYHIRIFSIYKEEYGLNMQRIISYLVEFIIYGVSIFRIILHMIYFITQKGDPKYRIGGGHFDYVLLVVILVNFLLYEVIRRNTIGHSINRLKQRNALIRLTNMISWERDTTYFIPKEVPTMNLYCKISWFSWYNARRVVESLYDTQKTILDFAQTIIGFYGLVIIFIMIVDYYGTLWQANKFFDDTLLCYLMGIDLIVITYQITANLFKGCDINQLYNVQINVISEFKIYLSQLSGQLDIIVDEDHIEVSESKEFFNSMAKLRSFQAIALIKREIILQRSFPFINKPTKEILMEVSKEQVTNDEIKQYLDDLKDTIDTISDHLDYDSNNRQEKFLGFIPVTYDYMMALAMSIIPLIGGIIWSQITNQTS